MSTALITPTSGLWNADNGFDSASRDRHIADLLNRVEALEQAAKDHERNTRSWDAWIMERLEKLERETPALDWEGQQDLAALRRAQLSRSAPW